MAAAGAGLVFAAVGGPGQGEVEGSGDGPGQVCQETTDLRRCEADQAAWAFGA
jgi:hypothetical protein